MAFGPYFSVASSRVAPLRGRRVPEVPIGDARDRQHSRSSKESDFLEHSDDLQLSFVLGMLFTCILAFGLVLGPGLAVSKVQEIFLKKRFHH